jgi:hypothetical protein
MLCYYIGIPCSIFEIDEIQKRMSEKKKAVKKTSKFKK